MQFQVGEEMHPVIRVDISDETSYVTMGVIHLDKSYRIHYGTVGRRTGIVYCFRVSPESIQSGINRNSRVHGRSSPDGVCLAKRVVVDRTFGINIQFQVIFEERRSHHDASRITFRIVCT